MPSGVTSFSSVATGSNFSCALANTGNVYCWGNGDSGQIGNDASSNVNVPTAVTMPSGVTSFRSIASGVRTNCAIANTGTVYCWGFGANGEIGNGANNNVNVPTAVTMPAGVASFSSVSTTYNFSCAVANTGVVYCWGYGGYGQIGNGASVTVNVPTAVTMPAGVTSFSAAWVNAGSSCALANTGVIYCWGTGTNGQIGNGADSNVNVPTAVTMPSGVTSFGYVSTNSLFSCAIAASGTNAGSTYCWGNGTSGQIGNGANNDVNVPTLVQ
jgi:alpha-tubulin suppressor-like RCC1 family protein